MKAYVIYKQLYDATGSHKMIGGIETYFFTLFDILIEAGYQPEVVQCATDDFVCLHDNKIPIRGYCVTHRNFMSKLYSRIENELKPEDLVIFGTDTNSPKVKHKKTLAIQHGIDFDYYPMEEKKRFLLYRIGLGKFVKWYQRFRAKNSFERATYRVCVDYNFWNWYRTFSLPNQDKNIFIIPNSANVPELKNEFKENQIVKILFARRFVRRRGVEVMLKAIEILNQYGVRAEYTFAGNGPLENKINEAMKKYSNIFKTSYSSEDAIAFHQQFDIAVVPTIGSEGTSFSLLEAMAAGNVVVCTPVGGMSNIILNGYNGIFVMPGSEEELVSAIKYLLEHPEYRRELSQKAHETVKKVFSQKLWKEKWLNLLSKIN